MNVEQFLDQCYRRLGQTRPKRQEVGRWEDLPPRHPGFKCAPLPIVDINPAALKAPEPIFSGVDLRTARGFELDSVGALLGSPRWEGEPDDQYRAALILRLDILRHQGRI